MNFFLVAFLLGILSKTKAEEYLPNKPYSFSQIGPGEFLYFKLKGNLTEKAELNVFLKTSSGNPLLYGYYCKKSQCSFTKDDLIHFIQTNEIDKPQIFRENSFLKVEKISQYCYEENEKEINKYLPFIYCEGNSSCGFTFVYNFGYQNVSLIPHFEYYSGGLTGTSQYFTIEDNNDRGSKAIVFNLISISGVVQIQDTQLCDDFRSFGKKDRCLINPNKDKNYNLTIEINVNKNAFYYAYYLDIEYDYNDHIFDSGLVKIHEIKYGQSFTLEYYPFNFEYVLQIYAQNCRMTIDKEKGNQFFQKIYPNKEFNISIEVDKMNSGSEHSNSTCYYYFNFVSNLQKEEVMLFDGVPNKVTFTKSFNKINYIFPFFYTNEDSLFPLYFTFTKSNLLDRTAIKIKTSFDNQQPSKMQTFTYYSSYSLEILEEIEKYCFLNSTCSIIFEVEVDFEEMTDTKSVEVTFMVEYSNDVPKYIENNVLNKPFYTYSENYLYSEIIEDQKEELFVGLSYSNVPITIQYSIIPKNSTLSKKDKYDWDVSSSDKQMGEIDSYLNYVPIVLDVDCSKACDVFFRVTSYVDFEGTFLNHFSYYFYINTKKVPIKITPNFELSGVSFYQNISYIIQIPPSTEEFQFIFEPNGIRFTLEVQEGPALDSSSEYTNKIYKIDSKKETTELLLKIEEVSYFKKVSYYSFGINLLISNNYSVYQLTHSKKVRCPQDKNKKYCYLFQELGPIGDRKYLGGYLGNFGEESMTILAKIISKNDFDKIEINNLIEAFPKRGQKEKSITNEVFESTGKYPKIFEFFRPLNNEATYILITLEREENSELDFNFYTSQNFLLRDMMPIPRTPNYYVITNKLDFLKFFVIDSSDIYMKIDVLKGRGKIKIGEDLTPLINNYDFKFHDLPDSQLDDYKGHRVRLMADDKETLVVAVTYKRVEKEKDKHYKLSLGHSYFINFLTMKLPLIFLCEVNNLSKDININLKFSLNRTRELIADSKFNVEAGYISADDIKKIEKDEELKVTSFEKMIYFNNHSTVLITASHEKYKENEKFIYLNITNYMENLNVSASSFEMKISLFSLDGKDHFLPIGQFIYFRVSTEETQRVMHYLSTQDKTDYMIVEFEYCGRDIDIPYNDVKFKYQNDTDVRDVQIHPDKNGRTYFVIKIKEDNIGNITFVWDIKKTNSDTINYMIKYNISPTDTIVSYIFGSPKVIFDQENYSIKSEWNPVSEAGYEGFKEENMIYYYIIYLKQEKIKNKGSICPGKLIDEVKKYRQGKTSERSFEEVLGAKNDMIGKKVIVKLSAYPLSLHTEDFVMSYTEENIILMTSGEWIWVLLIFVIFFIAITMIGFFVYDKMKKNHKKKGLLDQIEIGESVEKVNNLEIN